MVDARHPSESTLGDAGILALASDVVAGGADQVERRPAVRRSRALPCDRGRHAEIASPSPSLPITAVAERQRTTRRLTTRSGCEAFAGCVPTVHSRSRAGRRQGQPAAAMAAGSTLRQPGLVGWEPASSRATRPSRPWRQDLLAASHRRRDGSGHPAVSSGAMTTSTEQDTLELLVELLREFHARVGSRAPAAASAARPRTATCCWRRPASTRSASGPTSSLRSTRPTVVAPSPADPALRPSECNPIFGLAARERGARSVVHSHGLLGGPGRDRPRGRRTSSRSATWRCSRASAA